MRPLVLEIGVYLDQAVDQVIHFDLWQALHGRRCKDGEELQFDDADQAPL